MDDDFNTSGALAPLYDLAREVNRRRDAGASDQELEAERRTIARLLGVLGVDVLAEQPAAGGVEIGPFVDLLLEVRQELRQAKLWALSDQVRDRLGALGVVVEDKAGGGSAWHLDR